MHKHRSVERGSVPTKVLLSGGHEIGGVESFARSLAEGFATLGIPAEVVPPNEIFAKVRELRDPNVLKILSTTAVFACPLGKRIIAIAHGLPVASYQGYDRLLALLASFKLANLCSGAQLVAVSEYTANHLHAVFKIRVDGVILNPVKSLYSEPCDTIPAKRNYITYLGRLIPAKNLHRIIPPIQDLLDEGPGLKMCIIGDGPEKPFLMDLVKHDPRFEFMGNLDDIAVRDLLRRTKIFVSANVVEGLGITFLEALSQGCAVAMPAGGGGVEIALSQVGKRIHLLPLSFDRTDTLATLRHALDSTHEPFPIDTHTPRAVAASYLRIDSRFQAGKVSYRNEFVRSDGKDYNRTECLARDCERVRD